jgi:DNA-binding phage protein
VPTRKNSAFDRYVDEQKKSPTFAAEFARVGAEIRAVDDLIRAVDAARLGVGMSKADLARKVSTTPAAMRRLLTSGDANPTFTTVLAVLEAVGLRFTILPAAASKQVLEADFLAQLIAMTKKLSAGTKPVSKSVQGVDLMELVRMAAAKASKTIARKPSEGIFSASKPVRKHAGDTKHRKTA